MHYLSFRSHFIKLLKLIRIGSIYLLVSQEPIAPSPRTETSRLCKPRASRYWKDNWSLRVLIDKSVTKLRIHREPAKFGDENTTIRARGFATDYARQMGPNQLPNGETTPTLMEDFEARNEVCIVTQSSFKLKQLKGQCERLSDGEPYACITDFSWRCQVTRSAYYRASECVTKKMGTPHASSNHDTRRMSKTFWERTVCSINHYSECRLLTTNPYYPCM